jgi:hypothetical protein
MSVVCPWANAGWNPARNAIGSAGSVMALSGSPLRNMPQHTGRIGDIRNTAPRAEDDDIGGMQERLEAECLVEPCGERTIPRGKEGASLFRHVDCARPTRPKCVNPNPSADLSP